MTEIMRQGPKRSPNNDNGGSEDASDDDLSATYQRDEGPVARSRITSSTSRREANRRNSSRSTGPKSEKGKARAAQNSFRHGLSLPPGPEWNRHIKKLAQRIAGADRSEAGFAAARRIAEAQIQIVRVRNERLARLREASKAPGCQPAKMIHVSQKLAILLLERLADRKGRAVNPRMVKQLAAWQLAGAKQRAATVQMLTETFDPLNLYQGRALSRHKSAVRAWDRLSISTDQAV